MDADLLTLFDRLVEEKGHPNRSEAIRDLVRAALVEREWDAVGHDVAGAITLVFSHHHPVGEHVRDLQHRDHHLIVSTVHVHLDHDNCLEVLVVKGPGQDLRRLADHLIGAKGVKHGRLTLATTGRHLP